MDSQESKSLKRLVKKLWGFKEARGDANPSERFSSEDDEESLFDERASKSTSSNVNRDALTFESSSKTPAYYQPIIQVSTPPSTSSAEEDDLFDSIDSDEDEDIATTRLIFQGQREVSIDSKRKLRIEMELQRMKEENLRSSVPYLAGLSDGSEKKMKSSDIVIDVYQPTTTPLYLATQVLAALAVSLGSMVVGFSSGYTSPALVTMTGGNDTFTVTPQQASWVGGIMPLAALVGGILGGPLIEKLGRRMTILATAPPFALAWLLIACAPDVWTVLAGRALSGLCVGIASLSLPVYLGETLQPEVRGTLGLLPTALGNIGILVVFAAGMYLDWRTLAYLGAALPVPFFLLTLLIPETPRWHVSHGDETAARSSLEWLRGGNSADVALELKNIVSAQSDAETTSKDSTLRELLARENLKPLMIALGLMFFQQFSGINAVIFYTVMIFKDAGSTVDENLCTIIVGFVNFGATFLATVLIDRLGRKVLLYASGLAMVGTLMTLGGFFYVKHIGMDVSTIGWLPLASFVVFVVGFSLGFGPVPWLMMGEILPSKVRGPAASVATAFNWLCTFVVTKTFTDIVAAIGSYGAFWIFGSVCVIALIFVFFFVPETRGKSLEDIELSMRGRTRRLSSLANIKPLPTAC